MDAAAIQVADGDRGPTGITRWVLETVGAAIQKKPDWSFLMAYASIRKIRFDRLELGHGYESVQIPFPARLWDPLKRSGLLPPMELLVGSFDVMLGTAFITWPTLRAAKVPIIYDLSFRRYPEMLETKNLELLSRMVPASIRRADRIITISEAMRDEISETFEIDPSIISVVRPGVRAVTETEDAGIDTLPERFFLALGTLEPRKNLLSVLLAQDLLRQEGVAIPLVVVGGSGWRNDAILTELASRTGRGEVITTGYIDDASVRMLYRNAVALVFPSFYEGFGMPIIEAMAEGCPVITSDLPVFKETSGDAALYVDESDPRSIATAMRSLLDEPQHRAAMIDRGRALVRAFTWERAGADLIEACQRAVDSKKGRRVGGLR